MIPYHTQEFEVTHCLHISIVRVPNTIVIIYDEAHLWTDWMTSMVTKVVPVVGNVFEFPSDFNRPTIFY